MSKKGAGIILQSNLVYSGTFKLPANSTVLHLTEADDRALFDLEVKLKLGHYDCEKSLRDALVDFPVEAILQRPGLIAAVLDIVGSIFPTGINECPLGLFTPLLALEWLREFFQKCVTTYTGLADGSKCSKLPMTTKTSETVDSLTAQMNAALYAMRYPVLPSSSDSRIEFYGLNEGEPPSNNIETAHIPSLSGLAFAIVAASLPLLRARDARIASAVLSSVRELGPYIIEPEVQIRGAVSSNDRAVDLCAKRLQHIFNRIEQLVHFLENVHLPTSNDFTFAPSTAVNQADVLSASGRTLRQTTFDWCFLSTVCEIIKVCPYEWVQSNNVPEPSAISSPTLQRLTGFAAPLHSTPGITTNVCLGHKSISLLRKVVVSCKSFPIVTEEIGRHCEAVLSRVDPGFHDSVEAAHILWKHSDDVHSTLNNGIPDTVSPADLFHRLLRSSISCVSLLGSSIFPDQNTNDMEIVQKDLQTGRVLPLLLCAGIHLNGRSHEEFSVSVDNCVQAILFVLSSGTVQSRINVLGSILNIIANGESIESMIESAGCNESSSQLLHNVVHEACVLSLTERKLFARLVGISSKLNANSTDHLLLSTLAGLVDDVLASLATPHFMHALFLHCVMHSATGSQDNVVQITYNAQIILAISLLEELAQFVEVRNLVDSTNASQWASLLFPLKLLEWCRDESVPADGMGESLWWISTSNLVPVLHSIRELSIKIEDACASSNGIAAEAYIGVNLLGSYHQSKLVRNECNARIRRELVGIPMSVGGFHIKSGADSSEAFEALNCQLLQLSTDRSSEADINPDHFVRALGKGSHADTRKLFSIAMSPKTEFNVRGAAITQLIELYSDDALLATADRSWLIEICCSCIHVADMIVWDTMVIPPHEAKFISAVMSLLKLIVTRHSFVRNQISLDFRAEGNRLGMDKSTSPSQQTTIGLWTVDGAVIGSVLESKESRQERDNLKICIRPLLQAVFSAKIRNSNQTELNDCDTGSRKSTGANGSIPAAVLGYFNEIKLKCAQIIFAVAVNCRMWTTATYTRLEDTNIVETVSFRVCQQHNVDDATIYKSEPVVGLRSLLVPQLLANLIIYPKANCITSRPSRLASSVLESDDEKLSSLFQFAEQVGPQFVMPGNSGYESVEVPSAEILQLTLIAKRMSISFNTLENLRSEIISRVVQARNHSSLQEAIDVAGSFGHCLQHQRFLTSLINAGIMKGLEKILQVCPTSERDHLTLATVLELLLLTLTECQSANVSTTARSFHTSAEILNAEHTLAAAVLHAFFGAQLTVLRFGLTASAIPSSSRNLEKGSSAVIINQVQSEQKSIMSLDRIMLLLLQNFQSSIKLCSRWRHNADKTAQQWPAVVLEINSHPVGLLLTQVIVSESLSSKMRSLSASCLLELIRFHEGVQVLTLDPVTVDPRELYAGKSDYAVDEFGARNSSITSLCASIRLLKSPDSFRETNTLVHSLQVLHAIVQCLPSGDHLNSGALARPSPTTMLVINAITRESQWLLRLCYDRRNSVKILVIDLIRKIMTVAPGYYALCRIATIQESDNLRIDSEKDATSNTLFDHLLQIMTDCTECNVVRGSCLGVLVLRFQRQLQILMNSYVDGNQDIDSLHHHRELREQLLEWCCTETVVLFSNIEELIRADSQSLSVGSVKDALQLCVDLIHFIIGLESNSSQSSISSQHDRAHGVSMLIRTLGHVFVESSFLVRCIHWLSPTAAAAAVVSMMDRINLAPEVMPTDQGFSWSTVDKDSVSLSLLPSPLSYMRGSSCGWWTSCVKNAASIHQDAFLLKGVVAKLLSVVCGQFDLAFMQCMQRTSLVSDLIEGLANPGPGHALQACSFKVNWTVCMELNLLSAIILRNSRIGTSIKLDETTKFRGSHGQSSTEMVGDGTVPESTLRVIATSIERSRFEFDQLVTAFKLSLVSKSELSKLSMSAAALASASLRVLTLITESPGWSMWLGFGEPNQTSGSLVSPLGLRTLRELLSFRISLHNSQRVCLELIENELKQMTGESLLSTFSVLLARLDVVIGSLTSQFSAVRAVLFAESLFDTNTDSIRSEKPELKGYSVALHSCVSTIANAVSTLQTTTTKAIEATSNRSKSPAVGKPSTTRVAPSSSHHTKKESIGNKPAVATAGKWRTQVRGYIVQPSAASRAAQPRASRPRPPSGMQNVQDLMDNSTRLALWSTLVCLAGGLPGNTVAQKLAAELGLHELLSSLISACCGWTNLTALASEARIPDDATPSVVSKDQFTMNTLRVHWSPSLGQLAAAILSAASSFVFHCEPSKRLFLKTGAPKIQLAQSPSDIKCINRDHGQPSDGNMLNQLLSIAMSDTIAHAARCVCFNLISSLVLVENGATLTQKTMIGTMLSSSLQRIAFSQSNSGLENIAPSSRSNGSVASKRASSNSLSETAYYLVSAWGACLAAGSTQSGMATAILDRKYVQTTNGGVSGGAHVAIAGFSSSSAIDPSRNTKSYIHGGSGSGSHAARSVHVELEPEKASIPELIQMLSSSYGDRRDVMVSLVRCIGSMAAGSRLCIDGQELVTNSPGHRRLVANASSRSCLLLLRRVLTQNQNDARAAVTKSKQSPPVEHTVASVALWTLLHTSEQARSSWKLLNPSEDNGRVLQLPSPDDAAQWHKRKSLSEDNNHSLFDDDVTEDDTLSLDEVNREAYDWSFDESFARSAIALSLLAK